MRFNYKDYERAFPQEEKPKARIDPEDVMTEVIEKPEEKKEEVEDGIRTDGEPDTE